MKDLFDILDDEQKQAVELMLSGKNVALFGNAGTGKSFVIEAFKKLCKRRFVCLAPTGKAAIAINGMTIHRFFNFPIGVLTPQALNLESSIAQFEVMEAIETIIIDEISMVRADTFQAIDWLMRSIVIDDPDLPPVLSQYRKLPFGKRQIIVVGDFLQLGPVTKEEAVKKYLDKVYGGVFAFKTPAWRSANFSFAMLTQIHRQKDVELLHTLDVLRTGGQLEENGSEELERSISQINTMCTGRPPNPDAISICLTRKNAAAINRKELRKLSGDEVTFSAIITGIFPPDSYPVDAVIVLKIGLRVMLQANKYHSDGQYEYLNGETGTVTLISTQESPEVEVKMDSGKVVKVTAYRWVNFAYATEYDATSELQITQREVGSFIQLPLSLAYATTVHKAQGMTLADVNIVLGTQCCFAHGQLYTALSRCKTQERMVIDRPIRIEDSQVNPSVMEFIKNIPEEENEAEDDEPLE